MAMMYSGLMSSVAGYGADSLFSGYNVQLRNYSKSYSGAYSDNTLGLKGMSYSRTNYAQNDSFTPSYNLNSTYKASSKLTDHHSRYASHNNDNDDYGDTVDLVAPNEHARIWGDPHIVDADGGKYDFQEEGIFSLLEDKGLSVNGNLEKAKDGKNTYLTEAGLVVNGKQIHIDTDGTVTLGEGDDALELEDGETRQLGNGSYITRDGETVRVKTSEYKLEFQTNQDDKGNLHMNLDAYTKDGGVYLDGVNPTGLLGETFDEDKKALTKPTLDASDYERDDLYATDEVYGEEPGNEPGGNPFLGTFG